MSSVMQGNNLKHLGFFQLALASAFFKLFTIYDYLKGHTGPMHAGVQNVEDALKITMMPFLITVNENLTRFLGLLDNKVDEKLTLLHECMPESIKRIYFVNQGR